MRFKTKIGAVLTATAIATVGLAGQAGAWQYSMDIQSTTITDVSICAGTASTAGTVTLKGTSTYLKSGAPKGFGLGSTAPVTETLFADAAMKTPIINIAVPLLVTNQHSGNWLLKGQGTATLPATIKPGTKIYVGNFNGNTKTPIELTVNKPTYNCATSTATTLAGLNIAVPAQNLNTKLTTISNPASKPISINIKAGTYNVTQGSIDTSHPTQEDQPNERWYAVFYAADNTVVGTTPTTPDLATNTTTQQWNTGKITLTANATTIIYYHAPGTQGTNSIHPNLLNLN
jgi:hypothetical protein